jgi:hypothetical protein
MVEGKEISVYKCERERYELYLLLNSTVKF